MTPRETFSLGLKAIGLYVLTTGVMGAPRAVVLLVEFYRSPFVEDLRSSFNSVTTPLAAMAVGAFLLLRTRRVAQRLYPSRAKCCEVCGRQFSEQNMSHVCEDCGAVLSDTGRRRAADATPPHAVGRRLAMVGVQCVGVLLLARSAAIAVHVAAWGAVQWNDILAFISAIWVALVWAAGGTVLALAPRRIAGRLTDTGMGRRLSTGETQ